MAADVGRDVYRPDLLLGQFESRKYRPFGTADTEAGRPPRQRFGQTTGDALPEFGIGGHAGSLRPDGSIEAELQIITGSTNEMGFNRMSAR